MVNVCEKIQTAMIPNTVKLLSDKNIHLAMVSVYVTRTSCIAK